MLNTYVSLTQALLQNPSAPTTLYPTPLITQYINIARGQVAGEGECIRFEATLSTVAGQRNYLFSSIAVPTAQGIQGVINVRRISYAVQAGRKMIWPHPWPWFDNYYLSVPVPFPGPPIRWAQYGQGASGLGTGVVGGSDASGSFYLDPPPDIVYTLYLDCVCYPITLVADADPEAIPYLWTDAVPFWAAWYALMSSQTTSRMEYAKQYKALYAEMIARARQAANPSVERRIYSQGLDPAKAAGVSNAAV